MLAAERMRGLFVGKNQRRGGKVHVPQTPAEPSIRRGGRAVHGVQSRARGHAAPRQPLAFTVAFKDFAREEPHAGRRHKRKSDLPVDGRPDGCFC